MNNLRIIECNAYLGKQQEYFNNQTATAVAAANATGTALAPKIKATNKAALDSASDDNEGYDNWPSEETLRNAVLNSCFPPAARSLSDEIRAMERRGENSHQKKIDFVNLYGYNNSPCCTVNLNGRNHFKCAH